MGRIRGFRVATLFRRVFQLSRSKRPLSRLISWTRAMRTKARAILYRKSGYVRVGQDPTPAPKGYMAVYVGQKGGDSERILVPVVYLNHPLFGDLLKESEEEYGFDHPGGITIPCRMSELERVQDHIEATQCRRRRLLMSWRRRNTIFKKW